jgi:hypothetical protein
MKHESSNGLNSFPFCFYLSLLFPFKYTHHVSRAARVGLLKLKAEAKVLEVSSGCGKLRVRLCRTTRTLERNVKVIRDTRLSRDPWSRSMKRSSSHERFSTDEGIR